MINKHDNNYSNRSSRIFKHSLNLVLRTFSIVLTFLCSKGIREQFALVQTIRQPKGKDVTENGMFGYAIGSVGDLNQDGLEGDLKSSVLENFLLTALVHW